MTKRARRVGVGQILDKQDSVKTYNESQEGLIYNNNDTSINVQIAGADRAILTDDQSQIVSNKALDNTNTLVLKDDALTIQDPADATKQARLDAGSVTPGQTRTLSVPDTSGEILLKDNTVAVTAKTIDADSNTISNLETDNLKSGVLLTTVVSVSINDTNLFSAKCIKDYVDQQDTSNSGALTNHLNDTVGAHAASAISNTPSGNLAATDQQAVNNELQSDIDTRELASNKGAANGYCPLGADQKVPAANLPSYVDDVLEYANLAAFPVTGEANKIYIAIDTNLTYRWTGSVYAEISQSLALGETSTTAYRGDRGKTAYDHSQTTSGSHGITGSFVGTTDTQALTNKDYQGGTASDTSRLTLPTNTLSNLNGLTRKEGTIVYATDTDKVYYDDGTNLTAVGSGSGSGSLATYAQLKSDDDTGTWSTGNNATFLGGGSIAGTFTKQNATNPLNGTYSYTLVQAAGSLNDYIASDVQAVPLRSRGVTNSTDLVYVYDGSDNDIKWVVYDVTNATVVTPVTAYVKASSVGKTAQLVYDLPVTCTQVRFGAQVVVANDTKTLKFDDVQLATWTPQAVNLVEQESATYVGNSGGSIVSPAGIPFTTLRTSTLKNIGSWNGSVFTAKKKCVVNMSANVRTGNAYSGYVYIYVNRDGVDTYLMTSPASYTSVTTLGVTSSVELNPTDTLRVVLSNTNTVLNSTEHLISITATAISGNVVQSYQPSDSLGELRFLPQNVAPKGFISALGSSIGKTAGTYQGDAYYDLYKVLWTQSSVTAGEPYVISSAKGTDAATDWAANKTITIDVSGLVVRAFKSGTTGAVGAKQMDAFQGHAHSTPYRQTTGTTGTYGLGGGSTFAASTGEAVTDGSNGTPRTASETRMTNIAQYAFIRYGNDAPTLLALPISKENVFSARIFSTGVVNAKNADWLSVTLSDTSLFTIDISKLGLTVAPQVSVSTVANLAAGNRPRNIYVVSSSPTSIVIRTGYTDSVSSNFVFAADQFEIKIQKQSPDYTAPGVFISGGVCKEWTYDLTTTATNWTQTRARGTVFKSGDGSYHLKFNISGNMTTATRTGLTLSISGVTFKNGVNQSAIGTVDAVVTNYYTRALSNTGNLIINHSSGSTTGEYSFSGFVELESKPTFATMTE